MKYKIGIFVNGIDFAYDEFNRLRTMHHERVSSANLEVETATAIYRIYIIKKLDDSLQFAGAEFDHVEISKNINPDILPYIYVRCR